MEGKRTIEKIRLRNILSFGDKGEEIELLPLNVLIGQNASGKSNFIDIFRLLRSLPQYKGLTDFISKSGGISEWIWKGDKIRELAEIGITLEVSKHFAKNIFYNISLMESNQRLAIPVEEIHKKVLKSKPTENVLSTNRNGYLQESILSPLNSTKNEVKDYLIKSFLQIRIYDSFQAERSSEIRKSKTPDAPNDFLEENASNLALVLNDLEHRGDTKDKIVSYLKKFNPRIKTYSIKISNGSVQLIIHEDEKQISAMRLSDGTLRYLCLLAILCHPEPPPLICIEEPEVGLHPDILPTIAELLIDASQRTQLIVTTHSDILVSALSDVPEAVLVCEADEDGTHFKRLDKENLKEWLDEYELGEVWLRGGIGGTR